MKWGHRIFSSLLLLLLLSLCCNFCFAQTQMNEEVLEFALQEVQELFAPELEYTIRKCYSMELPEDQSEVSTEILNEYEGFDQIYLIEIGYQQIAPIVQSYFVCVGVDGEGAMQSIETPMHLVAKTYDMDALDSLRINEIVLSAE